MVIHVVERGDSLYSIAQRYGVGEERLITDNGLADLQGLVVGQTIVVRRPVQVHTVAQGETPEQIATAYGVSVITLLQNNPVFSANGFLYPGQTIVIQFDGERLGSAAVGGYVYPYVDRELLRRQLPYLTYLSLFACGFTPQGELVEMDDEELIAMAYEYRTAPLMVFAAMTPEGSFSDVLAASLFNDQELQDKILAALVQAVQEKGYYGVDVDFEFVGAANRDAFAAFVERLHQRMSAIGKAVFVTLAPKTSADQPGNLYEGHDFAALGAAADRALLMTYEWGYTYGPPMAVSPIGGVRAVVEYGISEIDPQKLLLGMPNYGYDWPLPYVRGKTKAATIGNVEAVELARRYGAEIQYDQASQAPFFHYYDEQGESREVWFEDARSVQALAAMVKQYNLYGIGIWQLMRYFPQLWMVLSSLYDITKLI